MRDACRAPAQAQFAELVQHRGGRRGDPAVAHRHLQHRAHAVQRRLEDRRIGAQQFAERDAVDAVHFVRVGARLARGAGPHQHRRDHITRAGDEVVEPADDPQLGDELVRAYDTAVLWLAKHWQIAAPGLPWLVGAWAVLHASVAGGVAVVAHPGRYKMSGSDMRRFLDDFKDVGGQGIEVTCGSHSPDHVMHFARLARHYAFHASRGSDFHGPEESYFDLGKLPQLPEDLKPVWRLVI